MELFVNQFCNIIINVVFSHVSVLVHVICYECFNENELVNHGSADHNDYYI